MQSWEKKRSQVAKSSSEACEYGNFVDPRATPDIDLGKSRFIAQASFGKPKLRARQNWLNELAISLGPSQDNWFN